MPSGKRRSWNVQASWRHGGLPPPTRRGCPSHPVTASRRSRHVPAHPPHSASRNPRHPVRPGPSPGHRKHPQKRRHSLLLPEIGLGQDLGGSASHRSSAWLRVRRPALPASARGMRQSNLPQDVRPHKTNPRDMPFGKDPTPRPAPPCRHRSPRPFCFLGDAAGSASAERTATHRSVPARQRRAAPPSSCRTQAVSHGCSQIRPRTPGRGRCRSSTLRAPGTSPCAIRSRNGLTSICSGQAARHLGISSCVHCRSQLRRSACSITPPENRQNQTALPARITHLATQEPGGLQRPALFEGRACHVSLSITSSERPAPSQAVRADASRGRRKPDRWR